MVACFLLHDVADVCIRGVSGQRNFCSRGGVLERYCRDEEAFGFLKSLRRRSGPDQCFWVAPQEVCQGF